MSTSDKFRKFSEMTSENDFIQALEKLVSGNAAVDSSASGTYETGINRPLGRLARNTDALLDVLQATKSCVLEAANNDVVMRYTSGGDFHIEGTQGIRIRLHSEIGGAEFNRIDADNSLALITGLSAGDVIYVQLDRTSNNTVSLSTASNWGAFVTTATNSDRLDYMVFGLVTPNNDVALFNGMTLRKDEKFENALATDSQYGQKFIQQQNKNLFMTGGAISFDTAASGGSDEITLADITIYAPGNGSTTETTVTGGTYAFTSDDCLYIDDLSRSGNATVTPKVAQLSAVTINKDTDDLFILAYRYSGNYMILGNGQKVRRLDEHMIGLGINNFKYTNPNTGTALTNNLSGDVTLKQSAATVIEPKDFALTGSEIRIRNRKDNRQVLVNTTLRYDTSGTNPILVFGSTNPEDGILISHPDYDHSVSSTYGTNRICPSGASDIEFTGDRQVAYVILSEQPNTGIGVDANKNYTSVQTAGNSHVDLGDVANINETNTAIGKIYICDLEDVPEDDAEVFIFAQRSDHAGACILWDGTYLLSTTQEEDTRVGMPLDRAIKSADFAYSHNSISFEWVRSGQSDSLGDSIAADRVAVHWSGQILIYWPAGGVSRIAPVTTAINITGSAPVAYITVPIADRSGDFSTTTDYTVQTGKLEDVNDVEDFILFRAATYAFAGSGISNTATSPPSERVQSLLVFGNRRVRQNYEASGGATDAVTGNAYLGRTTALDMHGITAVEDAIWGSAYPSISNPFLTANSVTDLKVGSYSGAEYEGSSATFTEKFSVAASDGDVVTKGTVQAVDYNYGDASGAATTKTKRVMYFGEDLETICGASGDAGAFTTDVAPSGTSVTFTHIYHTTSDGDQQTASGTGLGRVRAAVVPATGSVGMRFPVIENATLTSIRVYTGIGVGAGAAAVYLRASNNNRFNFSFSGTFAATSGTTLLTDSGTYTTVDGIDMVSSTSTVTSQLYGSSIFDFTDSAVSSGVSAFNRVNQLWVRIGNSSALLPLYVLGVELTFSGDSVGDLLGTS